MDYLLCGTDKRMRYLGLLLHQGGHRVLGLNEEAGAHVNTIDSPLQLTRPVRAVFPPRVPRETVRTVLATLPLNSRVYAFSPAHEEDKEVLCRRGICWVDLSHDDEFQRANAHPTAEGALGALIDCTEVCIFEATFVLLGSGRVAEACARLLLNLGARVVVCARNKEARAHLEALGCQTMSLNPKEKKARQLLCADAVLNTIPHPGVVSEALLVHFRGGTPILELASGQDNIDRAAADARKMPVLDLPALPAKVAPKSAARALFNAVTKEKKEESH